MERYRLLTALPGGKYRARLIILTEEYMEEFFRTAEKSVMSDVKEILGDVAKKLPKLRELRFAGSNLEDNPLLWALLFELTRKGWGLFMAGREEAFPDTGLYSQGDICYGSTYSIGMDHPYETMAFAGYSGFRPGYAACYADYCVLPAKNRFFSHRNEIVHSLDSVLAGKTEATVPVFDKEQMKEVSEILREEIASFAGLYESLYGCALSVMQIHVPETIREIVEPATAKVLLFITVGLIGGLAVRSGALTIPEGDRPLGGFVYRV